MPSIASTASEKRAAVDGSEAPATSGMLLPAIAVIGDKPCPISNSAAARQPAQHSGRLTPSKTTQSATGSGGAQWKQPSVAGVAVAARAAAPTDTATRWRNILKPHFMAPLAQCCDTPSASVAATPTVDPSAVQTAAGRSAAPTPAGPSAAPTPAAADQLACCIVVADTGGVLTQIKRRCGRSANMPLASRFITPRSNGLHACIPWRQHDRQSLP